MDELISAESARTAGVLLLTVVFIEYGGTYLLRILGGREQVTAFQAASFRAGHAHAGVLVTLALVCQLFVDASGLGGAAEQVARSGVAVGAIFIPAGFFLSAIGRRATKPNRLLALLWIGVVSVAAGVATLGVGLLT